MAASSGRAFLIKKNDVVLAGVREKSVSFDGAPVDITNDDDAGFRRLAGFAGAQSFEISASGVLVGEVLLDIATNTVTSKLLTDITIDYPNGDSLAGDVYLASFENTGTHDAEVTFTATLQSSGPWVRTAGA
jgi:predicted secreted protein